MAKKKKAVKAQPQPSAGAEPKAQGKAEAKPEVKVQTQVVIDDIPETKAKVPHPAPPRPPPPMRWDEYDGNGSLEDWNRFMKDLGFDSEFPSKTQCKKALGTVFVNIYEFLDAVECGKPVRRFPSLKALARYTKKHNLSYPRHLIERRNPLGGLLSDIIFEGSSRRRRKNKGGGNGNGNGNGQQDLVNGMIGLAIAV